MVKVRYSEGVAIHTDPESCAGHCREAVREALIGGRTGEVLSGEMHERRKQTNPWPAYAGSRLKLSDALGRHRRKCQPSSRTGENPPYGMIGGIEETSASCEARSAPRSYPTAGGGQQWPSLPR